ncbi:MAG TPA: hypothetical protein VGC15_20435 [Acetobacteraceae bacterium]
MSEEAPSRAEHLAWCKQRALEYVELGKLNQAVTSMSSDLTKHPDTARLVVMSLMAVGMFEVPNGPAAVRRWIEGIN